MDDDQNKDSGFGGLAWYQIGRWSAEIDQEHQQTFDHVSGRGPVPRAQYDYAVQMNQMLVAENQQLGAQVAVAEQNVEFWKENHRKLKEWADAAEAELSFYRETDPNRKLF